MTAAKLRVVEQIKTTGQERIDRLLHMTCEMANEIEESGVSVDGYAVLILCADGSVRACRDTGDPMRMMGVLEHEKLCFAATVGIEPMGCADDVDD